MNTYTSKTGYVKRIATGEIYEGATIFLGKFDDASNYQDATKEEYEAYVKAQEEELRKIMPM